MKTSSLLVCTLISASFLSGQTRYFINTVAGINPIGDNGPATKALLYTPTAIAVDNHGNLYIADSTNVRMRKVTPAGIITTIACAGIFDFSGGDGGPATQASCDSPNGVAVDAAGNVYFSDTYNNRVRKIGLDGNISTFAGSNTRGAGGDGGPATSASLNQPAGLALDPAGNLYIADFGNSNIRRVTTDGNISTVAGTGSCGLTGDGGAANQAQLCYPVGVSVDLQGRVLIADTYNNRIRRFVPGGPITTVAGTTQGFGGDNTPAIAASLDLPRGVVADSRGLIYITDSSNNRVRMVGTDGNITTIAGNFTGFIGDGGLASNATLDGPLGIAVDSQGNIYVADSNNHRIRAISSSRTINTVAGMGHYSGDNGPALSAILAGPSFLTLDTPGNLYVSDMDNAVVRKIDTTGKITTIAGTGLPGTFGDTGPATQAYLTSPQGLALDTSGNLYIADAANNSVRMVKSNGTIVKIAGGGSGTSLGDGGPALNASLNTPHGIALDNKGNLYIADTNNNRVRRVAPDGTISTFMGDGTARSLGDGGLVSAATTDTPWDVKVAADGTVFISERTASRVRSVSPSGIVSTVAFLHGDTYGIALDSAGKMTVASNNQIFSQNSPVFSKAIAGDGLGYGFGGDGAPASQAKLYGPQGIAIDATGNIYFCDQWNGRIRKLTPDTIGQLVLVSGDKQTGPAGATLPLPLLVQVNGASGVPFSGVTVTYSIVSGGGRLSANSTVTDSKGQAAVSLTLPSAGGTVSVTATVAGVPSVTFTATAVSAPGTISILGGNNQIGVAGSTLPQILAVLVLGVDKNPLAGASVTFAVTSGSATLTPTTTTTAFDGSAYTQLTLGATAGPITISATTTGLPPVMFNVTATSANAPQIFPGGIVGAGLSSPVIQTTAPNAIISIFGKNFAPDGTLRKVSGSDVVNGLLPTNLAGVCVQFGTLRAPIFLVTPGQLNVQVPQVQVPATPAVQVILNCDAPNQSVSGSVTVAVQAASPEFFYAAITADGKYPVAATDGQTGAGIGDPARLGPGFAVAHPGQTITIYATGLGLTIPSFSAGQLPPGGAQVNNISVSIDGVTLPSSSIPYAGVAPLNAGLYQLNLVLPASVTAGDHTISMTVAGFRSPIGYLSVGN